LLFVFEFEFENEIGVSHFKSICHLCLFACLSVACFLFFCFRVGVCIWQFGCCDCNDINIKLETKKKNEKKKWKKIKRKRMSITWL
jgi:hypothetical protein